ncbi:Hsp20/alpha crystallin family protein [Aporhodopirellula aestuarii]|uniref:Hsp20/alpha crystallin family protein n=1 Tax=Aporhodopirellula aestuarii TaxID=2950107 RepID=A0ABT0U9S0_9BACT|nr:Hsp20/alpha crystallin family protein [Aporhodopirellula aestuarii]MCM2373680.1 Hsp20/alpha crystallin family protein [Aporhodopirellula aestuarii]
MSTTMTTSNQNQAQKTHGQTGQSGNENAEALRSVFQPRFDIWEGDDELILYGDLPGVSGDDLDISFENRQLTIHGKVSRSHEGKGYLFSEYDVGDFHRTFTIGEAINSEAISAELHDGVLKLHLPKSEKVKPRRIEVKTG